MTLGALEHEALDRRARVVGAIGRGRVAVAALLAQPALDGLDALDVAAGAARHPFGQREQLGRERRHCEIALAAAFGCERAVAAQLHDAGLQCLALDLVLDAVIAGLGCVEAAVAIALDAADTAFDLHRAARPEEHARSDGFAQHPLQQIGLTRGPADTHAEVRRDRERVACGRRHGPVAAVEVIESEPPVVSLLGRRRDAAECLDAQRNRRVAPDAAEVAERNAIREAGRGSPDAAAGNQRARVQPRQEQEDH